MKPPTAFVMNMFYSGLGIARSLGENGIPVVGLSSVRGIYGNFTRYAKVIDCPDSRSDPEGLLTFLTKVGRGLDRRGVLFPTRDADLLFLDRSRKQLEAYFELAAPGSEALRVCLDKWETYHWALRASVPAPRCWLIERREQLADVAKEATYPCVLKPVMANEWRSGNNWALVRGRKAIPVGSKAELFAEYETISRSLPRALVQEFIPGGDERLAIMACYLDREFRWVAGFNTQKVLQQPEGFGTGCIVRAADHSELIEPTRRLLEAMRFSGIAEVEYKWDPQRREFLLIEINPRPWDQHRLGKACGTDLAHIAYCDHAGLPRPGFRNRESAQIWIAEDAFLRTALRLLWKRDPRIAALFRMARGRRTYAIWSIRDPLPLLGYLIARFLPAVAAEAWRALRAAWRRAPRAETGGARLYKEAGHQ